MWGRGPHSLKKNNNNNDNDDNNPGPHTLKKNNNNNENDDNNPGPDTSALWPTSKHHQFERHVPRPGKGASQYFFVF